MTQTEDKNYWKCTKCGFTLTQPSPPEQCPQCKEPANLRM